MKWFVLSVCYTSSVFGALPPLAQSAKEIQALVLDPQLQTLLGSSESIHEIVKTETGYAILTKSYLLRAHIEYQKNYRPGPVPFQFRFDDPIRLVRGEEGEKPY